MGPLLTRRDAHGGAEGGHTQHGAAGVKGPIAVPLFMAPANLPPSLSGVAGTVTNVPAELIAKINQVPSVY